MTKRVQNIHIPIPVDTHKLIKELAQFEDRSMRNFLSRFLSTEVAKAHAHMQAMKSSSCMLEGDQ